ncbi:MAG TPA: hypothetical protein VFS33_04110 [Gemmatimonadales bacterium]|nr:hypothetical protein [Gemmatimonadales bacterium]
MPASERVWLVGRRAELWWRTLLVLIVVGWAIADADERWRAEPYEPGLIAQSLATGHGFSYPTDQQWFYPNNDGARYRSTAWQEPIWPVALSVVYRVIPSLERARDAIIGINTLLLLFTAMSLVPLATALFGPERGVPTGRVAGVALVSLPLVATEAFQELGSAFLIGALVVVACRVVVWTLRAPSLGRGLLLGALLGVTALAGSATLLFAPVVAGILALAPATRRRRGPVVAAAMLLAWICAIAPWTYRNFRAFGTVVPIRTGFGLAAQSGNPVLAETFAPGIGGCPGIAEPPFRAADADAAMQLARADGSRHQLDARPVACVQRATGERFWTLNEAERDRISSRAGLRFIAHHPIVALQLAWAKSKAYYTGWDAATTWAAGLALVGLAVAVVRTGNAVVPIAGLTMALLVPYLVGVPYFYRYRYPAEPILLIFAAYACVAAWKAGISGLDARRRKAWSRKKPARLSGFEEAA